MERRNLAIAVKGLPTTAVLLALLSVLAIGVFALQLVGQSALADDKAVPALSSDKTVLQTTADYRKNEVVYASLDAKGAQLSMSVVNQFDVKTPGRIVDYGTYDTVQNLSTERALLRKKDATAFDALDAGVFYYEGTAEAFALPWNVNIEYLLDGEPCADPTALSGASGELEIRLQTSDAHLKDSSFYESFLQQITFSFPAEACTDVEAENATIASAGSNRTVAFTVLPGHGADCRVRMHIEDFHMDGVQIAALPYRSPISMPDTSSLASGMQELTDAASQLDGGARALSEGSAAYAEGISQLSEGTSQIDTERLNEYITLAQNTLAFSSSALFDIRGLSEGEILDLSALFSAIADLLEEIKALSDASDAAQDLPASWSSFDFERAIAQCRALAGYLAENAGQLASLLAQVTDPASAAELSEKLGTLSDGIVQLKDGIAQLNSGAHDLANGTNTYAQGVSLFNIGIAALPDELEAASEELMADYTFPEFEPHSFTSSKNPADAIDQVQFVIQSQAIEKTSSQEEAPSPEKQGFFDRLRALF